MRVGIIGCGIRGQLFLEALSSVSGVEVTAMCDVSAAARESASRAFGGRVFSDHRQLIESGPEAVIVATPDFAHRDAAVDVAAAGLDLLVEKPLATTVEDAEAIVSAVESGGRSCLVGFENRWNPYFIQARQMIEQGDLGEVISVAAVLSNTYYVPETMLSWAEKSSPGWFLMPHTLDLALWLTESVPTRVEAMGHTGVLRSRGVNTWDTVDALIHLKSGAIANLRSSWILPTSTPGIVDFRVEVVGSSGSVMVNMSDQGLHVSTGRYVSRWSLPAAVAGHQRGMAQWMAQDWARALLEGEPVGPDARHGLQITRIISDIHATIGRADAQETTSE